MGKREKEMKKYLSLIALVLTAGTVQADFWDNCTANGGTIIMANKYGKDANNNNLDKGGLCNDPSDTTLSKNYNGKKFCLGGKGMTWWSGFTWCEAIGGQLASFEHACPASQPVTNTPCPNFQGTNFKFKTSMGIRNESFVSVISGNVVFYTRDCDHVNCGFPLCEEKTQ